MELGKPKALLVDDDPDFLDYMKVILTKSGVFLDAVATPQEFIAKLVANREKRDKYDLCFIDLNIGVLKIGYHLITAIRNKFGPTIPIFIISGAGDNKSVTLAIELGANDFITKPVDKEILFSKISPYISSPGLFDSNLNMFKAPKDGYPASVTLGFQISSIDEFGIKFVSKHLLSKGVTIAIDDPIVKEVTTRDKPILVLISETQINDDGKTYSLYAEFDTNDTALMNAVRSWLTVKANPSPTVPPQTQ